MSANKLRLDQLRRQYRELVEAHKFEEAVDLLTEVGNLYYQMKKDNELIPAHFLDPKDQLL